jgi:hypothetical protein
MTIPIDIWCRTFLTHVFAVPFLNYYQTNKQTKQIRTEQNKTKQGIQNQKVSYFSYINNPLCHLYKIVCEYI